MKKKIFWKPNNWIWIKILLSKFPFKCWGVLYCDILNLFVLPDQYPVEWNRPREDNHRKITLKCSLICIKCCLYLINLFRIVDYSHFNLVRLKFNKFSIPLSFKVTHIVLCWWLRVFCRSFFFSLALSSCSNREKGRGEKFKVLKMGSWRFARR